MPSANFSPATKFILVMPKREQTLQAFLDNATLLIQARPTTTRVTLKYKVPKQAEGTTNPAANLVAKAFDPVGGVCLKYETNRAVEVGRLIGGFQELGQYMQNVPATKRKQSAGEEDRMAVDSATVEKAEAAVKAETITPATANQGGGGKKKKKAKR